MINHSEDNVERFYRALYAKVESVVIHQGSLILMKWNVTTVLFCYKEVEEPGSIRDCWCCELGASPRIGEISFRNMSSKQWIQS